MPTLADFGGYSGGLRLAIGLLHPSSRPADRRSPGARWFVA
jgi:hypothetical protein